MSENGRLLGIYIRDILMEGTEDCSITIKNIVAILNEKYNLCVDVTTVQRYINDMKKGMVDYELQGNKNGYYLKNTRGDLNIHFQDRLTDNELIAITHSIVTMNYLNDDDKLSIISKLVGQTENEATKDFILGKRMLKCKDFSEISKQISSDAKIILQNHPILITLKNSRFYNEVPCKFCVYNIIQKNGDLTLIGRFDSKFEMPIVFKYKVLSSNITSYKLLEDETFEKTPIKIKWFCSIDLFNKDEREILTNECRDTIILPSEEIIEKIQTERKLFNEQVQLHEHEIEMLRYCEEEIDQEKIDAEQKIIDELTENYHNKLEKLKRKL